MITANIIHRILRVVYGNSRGTAFAIDARNREYLVTASHVVPDLVGTGHIGVHTRNGFDDVKVRLVGRSSPELDTAVLEAERTFVPTGLPAEATTKGLAYGQDVYFLGFPYDFLGSVTLTEGGFPLPFVKKATLSCFDKDILLLDGHNNPGFSGGPVVFAEPGSQVLKIAGLISGYRFAPEPVYVGEEETKLTYRHNTGIIVAPAIREAVRLIEAEK